MKKYFLYILLTILSVCDIHAEFSLIHQLGMYNEFQENGMQKTHTDYQVMYAKPGETVYLYRPERSTFVGWVRWYCYDTDRAIPSWYSEGESPTGIAIPRIESTWAADTTGGSPKISRKNLYGWFAFNYASDRVIDSTKTYIEIKYTMHNGDSIYRIACDEGIWNDFTWNNNGEYTEPTLSKRIIFEIRPAKWIADSLELCKSTVDTCEGKYLEEHKLIAPAKRQLYIGPKYMYRCVGTKIKLAQYSYFSRSNYHYYDSNHNITMPNNDANWKWYKNGVEDTTITLQNNSSQFVPVYNSTPDTVIYTLKYHSPDGYYFNVARFKVIYRDRNIVGPVEELSNVPHKIDKIYEQTFNFEKPNTTDFVFWRGYLGVDESTYGYYDKNLDDSPSKRKIRQGNITWSEYAITNGKEMWADGSDPKYYLHQHVDGIKNNSSNKDDNTAKEGYMIYCDGSQQPGLVFNLKVNTNLCPGSTMYFSAWIADASSKRVKNPDRSAPNMDFEVIGIDDLGVEHAITTFTTGEFGVNAPEDRSRGGWANKTNQMDRGIWYQIMFPVKFTTETAYNTYRLRITNKSTSSDGNDFAIDDIRIYVQKPPVMPIQASTSDCIDKAVDSIRTYLRIDYQEIDHDWQPLYYQWRENDNIVHAKYYNVDGANDTIGKINLLPNNNITPADTCLDLLSFDKQFRATDTVVVRYIMEDVEDTSRYIMYIAMPMEVRINHEYTGFVSLNPTDLGKREGCGTFADMLVAGGTRITINDEITYGDSVVTVCGHRTYTLNIVLTKIIQDETTSSLKIDTTHCKADWLIGDSTYVNSHPEIYGYSFDEIERGLGFYRQHVPSAIQMVNLLQHHGLLVLDTASIIMNPGISLSYTAFPLDGSASDSSKVCITPRFLHINPAVPASNMMEVGDKDDDLPEEILSQPRIIRISNKQKNKGEISVPMHIKGDSAEIYEIDTVYTISSTNPNWTPIGLIANHKILNFIDTVQFTGNELKTLEAGYDYTFHVAFKGESDEDRCDRGYTYFTLRIIPDVVTWYGGKWNEDANWDYFIPMRETNVILMDTDYVVSFNDESLAKFDINYTESHCNNIYFPDGASMYGQEKITINGQAFIDIREYKWKWTLTSIPIKGAVSGDLFIKDHGESEEPFIIAKIDQTGGTSAIDRATWQVYRKEFDATNQKWMSATNSLNTPLLEGSADMIAVDCETNDGNPVIIRLPKQDNMYCYYGKTSHNWLDMYEDVDTLRGEDYGKPIWNGNKDFELKQTYDSVYLFGNPTFGYINIDKLIEDNSGLFTGEYYFVPTGSSSIPKEGEYLYNTIHKEGDETLLPPYRGILLKGKYASDSLKINVDTIHINPQGKIAARRTYTGNSNDNNIATGVDYINAEESYIIYDMMGRKIGTSFNDLSGGIYILRKGKNTYKILIER